MSRQYRDELEFEPLDADAEVEPARPRLAPGRRTLTQLLPARTPSPDAAAARRARLDALWGVPARTDSAAAGDVAAAGVAGPGAALPYLDALQRAFGPDHDLSAVRAHVGGPAAHAARAIGARAYATGNDVAFDGEPDLHTAAHEAAHVIQQRGGVQLAGGIGEAGDRYEQHADAVADAVVRGESAAALLADVGGGASAGGAVQRKESTDPRMLPPALAARIAALSPEGQAAFAAWLDAQPDDAHADPDGLAHQALMAVTDIELQERFADARAERRAQGDAVDARLMERLRQENDARFGGGGEDASGGRAGRRRRQGPGTGPITAPAEPAPEVEPAERPSSPAAPSTTRAPDGRAPAPAPQPQPKQELGPSKTFSLGKVKGTIRGVDWSLSGSLTGALIVQPGARDITRLSGQADGPTAWNKLSRSGLHLGSRIAKGTIHSEPIDGLQIDIESKLVEIAVDISKNPSLKLTLAEVSGTVTGIVPRAWLEQLLGADLGSRVHVEISATLTLSASSDVLWRVLRDLFVMSLLARNLPDVLDKLSKLFDDDEDGDGDDDDRDRDRDDDDGDGDRERAREGDDAHDPQAPAVPAPLGTRRPARYGKVFPFDPARAREALSFDGERGEPVLAADAAAILVRGVKQESGYLVGGANRPFRMVGVSLRAERTSPEGAADEEVAFLCWFEVQLAVPLRGQVVASTERFSMMMYPHAAGKDGKPQVHETEAVDLAALLGVLERRGRRVALQGQPEVDFGLFKATILQVSVTGGDLPMSDGALDLGGHVLRVRLVPTSNTRNYDSITVQIAGESKTLQMNKRNELTLNVPRGITL